MVNVKYRPEIDGLRAIAVISVMLFHAGYKEFSGGFVGVDIFFVISGYLITLIIKNEIIADNFRLIGFYERRVRRILPSLYCVIFITIPFSYYWLMPDDLMKFSESLIAVPIFLSNFIFWKSSGYFDTVAELKPLLHTWSLAIEEQYYLIFPYFLIFITKKNNNKLIIIIIILLLVLSINLAEWGSKSYPSFSFYMLPTRGWEFLFGALSAYMQNYIKKDFYLKELLNWIGLLLILWAIFNFNNLTINPGYLTLLPTFGTFLIILFCDNNSYIGKILSCKLLVKIGIISYSIYLWHQPIFAIARHRSIEEISKNEILILILIIIILGYFTWRFVEKPFRNKEIISSKKLWILVIISSSTILLIGGSGLITKGFENNYISNLNERQKKIYFQEIDNKKNDSCQFISEKINHEFTRKFEICIAKYGKALLIIGDSHAENLYNSFVFNLSNPFIISISGGGCRPQTKLSNCPYDDIIKFTNDNYSYIDKIYFMEAGFYLLKDDLNINGGRVLFKDNKETVYEPNITSIEKVITYLKLVSKKVKVIWIGPWIDPFQDGNTIKKLALNCKDKKININDNIYKSYTNLDAYLEKILKIESDILYISSIKAINFNENKDIYDCNAYYWRDTDHFSVEGERKLGDRIVNAIKKFEY